MNDLPFTKRRSDGTIDAWDVTPSQNYTSDCATGNAYFDQLTEHVETAQDHRMIAHVLQAMVVKGALSGVEIGFLHSLSAYTAPSAA